MTTTMKMPLSYCAMSENDMANLNGGAINLPMERRFLKKAVCEGEADRWISRGVVGGISRLDMAKEIFAHAIVFYNYSWFQDLPIAKDIYASAANGIYIEDGLDSRAWAFDLIWATHAGE